MTAVPAVPEPQDELRLCFYVRDRPSSSPRPVNDACTLDSFFTGLEQWMGGELLVAATTDSAAGAASAVLWREVLLQKCDLPGFGGVLPAAWVPEASRRRAVQEALIVSASDAGTVLRVLTSAERHISTRVRAFNRLRLLAAAPNTWSAADVEAAHAEAVTALEFVSPTPALIIWHSWLLLAVVSCVATLARRVDWVAPPSAVALVPVLMRACAPYISQRNDVRADSMLWLQRWMCGCPARSLAPALHAFVGAGGPTFAIGVLRAALAAGLPAHDNPADHFDDLPAPVAWNAVEYALKLLMMCYASDVPDASMAIFSTTDLDVVMDILRVKHLPGAVLLNAISVVSATLGHAMRLPACDAGTKLCAAVAESDAPQLAQYVLRARSCHKWLTCGCELWVLMCVAADIGRWPGGAPALAALATELQVQTLVGGREHLYAERRATLPPQASKLLAELRKLFDGERAVAAEHAAAAAERAAAELLAEESRAGAAAAAKAAAKSRKAAAAAEAKRVRDEQRAAAAAEAAAAEEAAAAAAKARADGAAAAESAAAVAAAAAARARTEAAAERRRQQQAKKAAAARSAAQPDAAGPATAAPPPALPLPLPVEPPAEERRATDAELAALFPWMSLDVVQAPPPPPAASAAGSHGGGGEDDGDDGSCAICMDAERSTALVPCGHTLLCATCAAAVLATAAPSCPVCRVPSTGFRAAA
jgi:hypothetical protein